MIAPCRATHADERTRGTALLAAMRIVVAATERTRFEWWKEIMSHRSADEELVASKRNQGLSRVARGLRASGAHAADT